LLGVHDCIFVRSDAHVETGLVQVAWTLRAAQFCSLLDLKLVHIVEERLFVCIAQVYVQSVQLHGLDVPVDLVEGGEVDHCNLKRNCRTESVLNPILVLDGHERRQTHHEQQHVVYEILNRQFVDLEIT